MKKIITLKIIFLLTVALLVACQKQDDWLNEKSAKSDVVPETLADFQAILDNTMEMNQRCFTNTGIVASDNIQVPTEKLSEIYEFEKNIYLWDRNVWEAGNSREWNYGFRVIEFANYILEELKEAKGTETQKNSIEGQARFFRAIAMYSLTQLFCTAYQENTADTDLGLPIRESSDVNKIIRHRSSMKQTFGFIVADLQRAISLLPSTQLYFQRPTTIGAKGLLSKIYLLMGDYPTALEYSEQVLATQNQLLDFNNTSIINYNSDNRFPYHGVGNPEIIFYGDCISYSSGSPTTLSLAIADPELYDMYDSQDLRKILFFTLRDNQQCFAGTYNGDYQNFSGIATNEVLLIKAECEARRGSIANAMNDLNLLLTHRYKTGTFIPLTANNAEDALSKVLRERRKELPMTGNVRWEDLKRLNHDPRFQKTISRNVNGSTITLPPNDKRYVFPIPENEIKASGIEQNDL
jgi:SusD family.